MFKIGEFSKLTQVSIRMLRYYDEVNLLKPEEVDKWTGHRMYSALQIPKLNRILYLRDSGFNVSEIALALEMDDSELVRYLEKSIWRLKKSYKVKKKNCEKLFLHGVASGRKVQKNLPILIGNKYLIFKGNCMRLQTVQID